MKSLLVAALLLTLGPPAAPPPKYDLILRGGRIVDGTGNPWYRADVAIQGDRIAVIAPRIDSGAIREIQAEGLVVAPRFIVFENGAMTGSRPGVVLYGPAFRRPPVLPLLDKPAA